MYAIDRSDALQHHGILGQKWGIRRYQNTDGSLTSAGRLRYGYSEKDQKKLYKAANKFYKNKNDKTKNELKKLINESITGEQKTKLAEAFKAWDKVGLKTLEAQDKLDEYWFELDSKSPGNVSEAKIKKQHPELAKIVKDGNKVFDKYYKESEKTVDELLGKYKDIRLSKFGQYTADIDVGTALTDIIKDRMKADEEWERKQKQLQKEQDEIDKQFEKDFAKYFKKKHGMTEKEFIEKKWGMTEEEFIKKALNNNL